LKKNLLRLSATWLAYYGSVQQLDRNRGNGALLLF